MSFYDEIEARYDVCLKKTDGVSWDETPQWYIAYAELAFLRSAHKRAHLRVVKALLKQAMEELDQGARMVPKETINEALALLETMDK